MFWITTGAQDHWRLDTKPEEQEQRYFDAGALSHQVNLDGHDYDANALDDLDDARSLYDHWLILYGCSWVKISFILEFWSEKKMEMDISGMVRHSEVIFPEEIFRVHQTEAPSGEILIF